MPTEQISATPPEDSTRPGASEQPADRPDWGFATRPFWVLSHLFAVSVVALFVVLGFWQLDRMEERRAENVLISSRTAEVPLIIESTNAAARPDGDVDFRRASAFGTVIAPDVARITNRSQGGVAGEYIVALLELDDGTVLAVNRGFIPINTKVEVADLPVGAIEMSGWLRDSVAPEGWFAVADLGEGRLMPRFDTSALSGRIDQPLPPYFLQLAPDGEAVSQFPDPVSLPELSEGPHLSYAVQWFIFATLGTAFYLAVVRRRAHRGDTAEEPS